MYGNSSGNNINYNYNLNLNLEYYCKIYGNYTSSKYYESNCVLSPSDNLGCDSSCYLNCNCFSLYNYTLNNIECGNIIKNVEKSSNLINSQLNNKYHYDPLDGNSVYSIVSSKLKLYGGFVVSNYYGCCEIYNIILFLYFIIIIVSLLFIYIEYIIFIISLFLIFSILGLLLCIIYITLMTLQLLFCFILLVLMIPVLFINIVIQPCNLKINSIFLPSFDKEKSYGYWFFYNFSEVWSLEVFFLHYLIV